MLIQHRWFPDEPTYYGTKIDRYSARRSLHSRSTDDARSFLGFVDWTDRFIYQTPDPRSIEVSVWFNRYSEMPAQLRVWATVSVRRLGDFESGGY